MLCYLCLSCPAPPSVPHLWLAAPQSLLLQTQNTKPFGLLRPHKSKTTPCLSSRAATLVFPCTGGHQQQDLFALPVLLSQSLISHGHESWFSPDPKHLGAAVNPTKEGRWVLWRLQEAGPRGGSGRVQGSEQAEAQPLPAVGASPGARAVPVRRQQPLSTELHASLKSRP